MENNVPCRGACGSGNVGSDTPFSFSHVPKEPGGNFILAEYLQTNKDNRALTAEFER